jgi:branched-chain amino acid transport system substrate-binding protein
MHKLIFRLAAFAAGALVATSAQAQNAIKIGLIMPYSGQFADTATQMDNAIKLYVKQKGETVAGRKLEFIRKDVGGIAPDVAKRLAQELIVRDSVDILAGFVLTPNAMAAGDVSQEAKKFMVVMNAATSAVINKSNFMVRTSMTLPQVAFPFGTWAATKGGIKKCYTMVTDYGPGHDVERAFTEAFKASGGEIVGSVRMAVANPDFSAYVQRAKDLNPECIMIFIPGGAQPAALGKAFAERGLSPKSVKILGTGETTSEEALKGMGDAAIGIISAWHFDYAGTAKANQDFTKAYNAEYKRNPDFFSVGGYDGMHVIYEALKKTGGKTDAEALIDAAKGLKWESPRGPMSVDATTRDVVQTMYIRRVEKKGNELINVVFDKVENVRDPYNKK